MSSPTTPVWFITGASSGFGQAVAKEALGRGHRVVACARSTVSLSDLAAAGATVMARGRDGDGRRASGQAGRGGGHAAGYILEGAVEEASGAESAALFNTNVQGAVNISKAAIPHLRRAAAANKTSSRPAVLANFGSVGSWRGGPACAHYCSSKWAVSGLSEGLTAELAGFGVAATVIEPGYFRTGFLNTADGAAGRNRRVRTATPLPDVYGAGTAVAA
ncbi:3-oxoacyl-[acyl-carrier-protein] reductase, partial [Magnaporthiopsis poae ATCC 64411]